MTEVNNKRFELHALHDKQVIKVPVSSQDRKLFLGRSSVQGQPKEVPKVAVVLAESRAGTIRLMVNSKKPVVVHRPDGSHVLNDGDECNFRHGDEVEVVQGLPYKYRLVYEERAQKKVRKGIKPPPEVVKTFEPTVGLMAFPSLSTGIFKFDPEKAVAVALDAVQAFLRAHPEPSIRLLLVDSIKTSPVLSMFTTKWRERGGDPRFSTISGNLLRLGTNEGLAPQIIVDPTNVGFNVVSGLNQFLHIAGAPHLLPDTQALYEQAEVGHAYPVRVRPGCPLHNEGCRYVLHVLGPNMNPCWPECLRDDYEQGCQLLKLSYENMLATYHAIVFQGQDVPVPKRTDEPEPEPEPEPPQPEGEVEPEAPSQPARKKRKRKASADGGRTPQPASG